MNPFRDQILRKTYDAMVEAYRTCDKDLFHLTTGRRNTGNGWSAYFWRGYDNTGLEWDRASKRTPSYACWRAGRDIAKQQTN